MESDNLRILIADDNNTDRLILNKIVCSEGHTTFQAADGLQAVALFDQEKPDLILLDALMPNMDGFEAAREIKKRAGEELVPIIFLTSLKEAGSLAECLEAGGDDFLSKPYNKIILKAKIAAFERMLKLHSLVMTARDEIARHNDHLLLEQQVAKAVFDNIAHPGCLEAENIKFLLSPMAVFNGDLLLAAPKPNGNLQVFLGDFTGHGLPAAIGAMPASEIFYGMTQKGFAMPDILKEINAKLKKVLPVGVFCCGCMIEINHRDEVLDIWNGGLPDALIYKGDTLEAISVASSHLPLGIIDEHHFNAEPEVLRFEFGDRIYLWSDGIHEEENSEGEMFGTDALMEVFSKNTRAEKIFEELQSAVIKFTGTDEQCDDHSVVEVCQVAITEHEGQEKTYGAVTHTPMDWSFQYELRPDSLRNSNPLPLLMHVLMEIPGLRPHNSKIYTILSELFSNAFEHGVMGLSSSLKSTPAGFADYYNLRTEKLESLDCGFVRFKLDHQPSDDGGILRIEVEDSGEGFNFQSEKDNEHHIDGYCGRGIPLIKTLCENFAYMGHGNHVQADFRWSE